MILKICCKSDNTDAFDAISKDDKVAILGLASLAVRELELRHFRKGLQEVESETPDARS